jgi:hypothetical protein
MTTQMNPQTKDTLENMLEELEEFFDDLTVFHFFQTLFTNTKFNQRDHA